MVYLIATGHDPSVSISQHSQQTLVALEPPRTSSRTVNCLKSDKHVPVDARTCRYLHLLQDFVEQQTPSGISPTLQTPTNTNQNGRETKMQLPAPYKNGINTRFKRMLMSVVFLVLILSVLYINHGMAALHEKRPSSRMKELHLVMDEDDGHAMVTQNYENKLKAYLMQNETIAVVMPADKNDQSSPLTGLGNVTKRLQAQHPNVQWVKKADFIPPRKAPLSSSAEASTNTQDISNLFFLFTTPFSRFEKFTNNLRTWTHNFKYRIQCGVALPPDEYGYAPIVEQELRKMGAECVVKAIDIQRYEERYVAAITMAPLKEERIKWVVYADDDTFFFVPNLLSTLREINQDPSTELLYLGSMTENKIQRQTFGEFGFGGAGVVLSRALAIRIQDDWEGIITRHRHMFGGDGILAAGVQEQNISMLEIPEMNQLDLHGDISGLFESGYIGPQTVSLHHPSWWKLGDDKRSNEQILRVIFDAYYLLGPQFLGRFTFKMNSIDSNHGTNEQASMDVQSRRHKASRSIKLATEDLRTEVKTVLTTLGYSIAQFPDLERDWVVVDWNVPEGTWEGFETGLVKSSVVRPPVNGREAWLIESVYRDEMVVGGGVDMVVLRYRNFKIPPGSRDVVKQVVVVLSS